MRKVSALLCLAASLAHAYHNPVFTALLKTDDAPAVTAKQIFKRCDLNRDQEITREEYVRCTHNYEGWDAVKKYDENRD